MAGRRSSTIYDVVYSWKRSPEVWAYFLKLGAVCFIAGLITAILLMPAPAATTLSVTKPCGVSSGR